MSVVNIPVTKGKASVEVELDNLPEEVYREAMIQGMKVLLNRGMSKITKETYPAEEELHAAAMAKAAENLEACKEGKIRFTGSKSGASKVSGAVKTEAMRLARASVKDALKADGFKISHYAASDITAAAKLLVEENPVFIETAKANLVEREKTPIKINVSAIPVSPEKVKAAEAKKAKGKDKEGTISAKQASMTAKRKGGKPSEATAH